MTTSVTGKVTRLYVDGDTCFIRIAYNQSSLGKPVPANNYFQLKKAADNYDAMYSLAMAAAFNDRALWIRALACASGCLPSVVQARLYIWGWLRL